MIAVRVLLALAAAAALGVLVAAAGILLVTLVEGQAHDLGCRIDTTLCRAQAQP